MRWARSTATSRPTTSCSRAASSTGAKIIDFGIAKDLDPGSATIVGDGFAGKLNYVAPEQLGDFGRDDRPVDRRLQPRPGHPGGRRRARTSTWAASLVDAVDKRRAGPDLSAAPDELRPVLDSMLKANPAERLQSMDAVIHMLPDARSRAPTPPVPSEAQPAPAETPHDPVTVIHRMLDAQPAAPPQAPALEPEPPAAIEQQEQPEQFARSEADWQPEPSPGRKFGFAAGGALAIVLAIAGIVYLRTPDEGNPAAAQSAAAVAGPGETVGDPVEAARTALKAGLPSAACTWLDVTNVSATDKGVTVALNGVAGKPAEAQGQIARFLAARGLQAASVDFQDVSPIEVTECGPLDVLRQIRDDPGGRISVAQRQFEMGTLDSGEFAGKIGLRPW